MENTENAIKARRRLAKKNFRVMSVVLFCRWVLFFLGAVDFEILTDMCILKWHGKGLQECSIVMNNLE